MIHLKTSQITLPVMETFYSIQGEGFHQGKAAHFIRLAGCDVGCVWCDVKESWPADTHPQYSIDKIVETIKSGTSDTVIITGGEPLLNNLDLLTQSLKNKGYKIHLETSGTQPLSGTWDWICLSPKKFKPALPEVYKSADELKVVIYNRSDFHWAEEHRKLVGENCKLYLQPEWSKFKQLMPYITEYIKNNPYWTVSLQVHKFMDIP